MSAASDATGKLFDPATEIVPPGALTAPRSETVCPLKETLAPASVAIVAPAPITTSPRTSISPVVIASSDPSAEKLKLVAERNPAGLSRRCSATLSAPGVTASQLSATGAIRMPGAMLIPGMEAPALAAPMPLSE